MARSGSKVKPTSDDVPANWNEGLPDWQGTGTITQLTDEPEAPKTRRRRIGFVKGDEDEKKD